MSYITETTENDEKPQILDDSELPELIARLPWETGEEHSKFLAWLLCPRPRSVRGAYRFYCEQQGITPKRDPPPSWFKLARGTTAALATTEKQLRAIVRAGEVWDRFPNWPAIEAAILASGQLATDHYSVEFELLRTQWAFWSLAIDLNGDPLPGAATWEGRRQAYEQHIEKVTQQ